METYRIRNTKSRKIVETFEAASYDAAIAHIVARTPALVATYGCSDRQLVLLHEVA